MPARLPTILAGPKSSTFGTPSTTAKLLSLDAFDTDVDGDLQDVASVIDLFTGS